MKVINSINYDSGGRFSKCRGIIAEIWTVTNWSMTLSSSLW